MIYGGYTAGGIKRYALKSTCLTLSDKTRQLMVGGLTPFHLGMRTMPSIYYGDKLVWLTNSRCSC